MQFRKNAACRNNHLIDIGGRDRTVTFHGPMEEDAGAAEAQSQQVVAAQVGNCLRDL